MKKIIKLAAGKRTLQIGSKRYFLELPKLVFHLEYEYKKIKRLTKTKRLNIFDGHYYEQYDYKEYVDKKYYDLTKITLRSKVALGNIGSDCSVCLGKYYFDVENFPNNVIERFLFSKFSKYLAGDKLNDYFYSQWEKYGIKYHNFMYNEIYKGNVDLKTLKFMEKRFFKKIAVNK